MGVTQDGKKEVIDFALATSENNINWERFLSNLIARGLGGKLLEVIVYDGEQAIIRGK